MKGLSPRNLKYMRALAEAWPDALMVQQVVAQIPWGHLARILDKVREPDARMFYVEQATQHGWSRDILVTHVDRRLHERQGNAVTNFDRTLTSPRQALVAQTLKDPYVFDFLGLTDEAAERDVERAMMRHIRDTLLEMGVGFAFVGNQVRIEVADEEFFLDLLFYHLRLHCYVVVELKAGEFRPEHAGKLNFYLSAVDDLMRDPDVDGPSIGLLLCKSKNRLMAEYALRDIHKPIGVANLELTRLLPEELTSNLPTVETLEAELGELLATNKDEE
jgi:predicted nuclease of restriction endonuclease-like (RecB) superfamily